MEIKGYLIFSEDIYENNLLIWKANKKYKTFLYVVGDIFLEHELDYFDIAPSIHEDDSRISKLSIDKISCLGIDFPIK
jgi:hypothetical protein